MTANISKKLGQFVDAVLGIVTRKPRWAVAGALALTAVPFAVTGIVSDSYIQHGKSSDFARAMAKKSGIASVADATTLADRDAGAYVMICDGHDFVTQIPEPLRGIMPYPYGGDIGDDVPCGYYQIQNGRTDDRTKYMLAVNVHSNMAYFHTEKPDSTGDITIASWVVKDAAFIGKEYHLQSWNSAHIDTRQGLAIYDAMPRPWNDFSKGFETRILDQSQSARAAGRKVRDYKPS